MQSNPYQPPSLDASKKKTCHPDSLKLPPYSARLIEARFLRRWVDLSLPEGVFCVEWNGRSPADRIEVDGRLATYGISWFWFVPHFEFTIGEHRGVLDVQIGWRLNVKRFSLSIDGRLVYEE